MLALYELINLLPKSLDPALRPKLKALFVFLKESKRLEEETAAANFLGKNKKHFNKLKNELKDTLCSYIITNPSTWVDSERKALSDHCYKAFATYKILLASGRRQSAIERVKLLFPKLCQLENHGLIYMTALDLQFHYSNIELVPKLSRKYAAIIEEQTELIRAEALVRKCHNEMGVLCNTRSSFSSAIVQELDQSVQLCLPFLALKSVTINRFIYDILVIRYIVVYDYKKVIKYCDEALESFPLSSPNYNMLRFDFLQKKIPALMGIGELNEAKEIAKEIGKIMPIGMFNWHIALIRRIIICFHLGDYQEAYDLFKAHEKYKSSFEILKEYWKILEGFIYFLILVGRIENYKNERFLIGKFVNEVPIYSRDKAGNNINILIVQILLQMHREEYGKIIDRIESLREYARTYTRNPETRRANIFINMILKMESASFHQAGTIRKTKGLLKKLNNTPLSFAQNLNIEIIPFPILWDEILGMLENKFRARRPIQVHRQFVERKKK